MLKYIFTLILFQVMENLLCTELTNQELKPRVPFTGKTLIKVYFLILKYLETTNDGPFRCSVQSDGNLVLYNAKNAPVWASDTWSQTPNGPYYLTV